MANGESAGATATLVISVWYEAEHSEPFRARLAWTSDDPESGTVTRYAATREAVLSMVNGWLGTLPAD